MFKAIKKYIATTGAAVALFLSNPVMADNSNDIVIFEQELQKIEISIMEDIFCNTIQKGSFKDYKLQLTEWERDRLVNELHYHFRRAKDAILRGREAVHRVKDIDMKEASRAAFEGCLAGMAVSRSGLGSLVGGLVATLVNIAGQKYSDLYDVISYAKDAQYHGFRFDDIHAQIQRG